MCWAPLLRRTRLDLNALRLLYGEFFIPQTQVIQISKSAFEVTAFAAFG
jgi:hypothetical protein